MIGKLLNNYYYGKSGKGDFRKEDLPKNRWQLFWAMLRTRFSGLCRLNLITAAAWLPLILLLGFCAASFFNAMVLENQYLHYLETGFADTLTQAQIDAFSAMEHPEGFAVAVGLEMVFTCCLWAVPCILITGPCQAGMAYVTRNWARDEHAFVWADFKDAAKNNWKQALGVSAITSIVPLVVFVCYRFYGEQAQSSVLFLVPQMLILTLGIVWFLALTYLYPMLVSYQVSFGQLIKNSLLMAVGRLPQTAGVRLITLLPTALCLIAFFLTGSLMPFMLLAGYYLLVGNALARFIFASYTNGVFDRFINSRLEGVPVNRGLADPEDLEEEDDAGEDPSDPSA